MAIKDCTIPYNFHLLDIKGEVEDKEEIERFKKEVNDYNCTSREVLENLFKGKPKDFHLRMNCWWITTSNTHKVSSLFVKNGDANMTKDTYKYYYILEKDAYELFKRLKKTSKTKTSDGDNDPCRYMADSSGSENGHFSHGFEALLDFQLSWNCRYACYGETDREEPSTLKRQCNNILNVLVNPKYVEGKSTPIAPKYLCVYKQVSYTDLVIELIAEKNGIEKKYIILVEDKAFTSLKENQILKYPFDIYREYEVNKDWEGFEFLLRVVTLQSDEVERIKQSIKEMKKGYVIPKNNPFKLKWEVLCDDNLLLKKNDSDDFLETRNPLFDQFWIVDRSPVDPKPLWKKADKVL